MALPRLWHRRRSIAALGLTVAVTLAGCSSSASTADQSTTSETTSMVGSAQDWKPIACDREIEPAPEAKPVADRASDFDITSFDGTSIRAHWFPLEQTAGDAPTVLMGPGWSLPGDTNVESESTFTAMNVLTISGLHDAGYNVLTWDPRGFGASTGIVTIASPEFEAGDVSKLLDWVATREGVLLDSEADPRVGMVGASYGGAIQLVSAAVDCRIDAITPTITWNSLGTSLFKAETVKSGWTDILVKLAEGRELDPHVYSAEEAGKTTGRVSKTDMNWFLARGPDRYLDAIHIPTLLVQGTVDGLFTLDEAAENFLTLAKAGLPVSMLWYCGGHGTCLTDPGPDGYVSNAVLAWLDRYVKGNKDAAMVPAFQTVDQNGDVHEFTTYPANQATPLKATGKGTLRLEPEGGSGPITSETDGDVVGGLAAPISPAKATNAVNVAIRNGKSSQLLLGAPKASLTYTGSLDEWVTQDKPTRAFLQIVDEASGNVVGNMVTPFEVVLDGKAHTAVVPLEMIAFDAPPGAELTLQVVATTVAYAQPQMGGSISFSKIHLSIPTAAS